LNHRKLTNDPLFVSVFQKKYHQPQVTFIGVQTKTKDREAKTWLKPTWLSMIYRFHALLLLIFEMSKLKFAPSSSSAVVIIEKRAGSINCIWIMLLSGFFLG